jgi:hypothetical protein
MVAAGVKKIRNKYKICLKVLAEKHLKVLGVDKVISLKSLPETCSVGFGEVPMSRFWDPAVNIWLTDT